VPRKSSKAQAVDTDALESLARAALAEVTPEGTVGALLEVRPGSEDGLRDLVFAPELRGYAGWSWIVTVAAVTDAVSGEASAPTVLELGLLPAEGALLAPAWVPWSVRLAEWEAQQAALAAEAAAAGAASAEDDGADTGLDAEGPDGEDDDLDEDDDLEDDTDEDDDLDEDDDDEDADDDDDFEDEDDTGDLDADDDFDEDDLPVTHGGDIDGVDIDELDDGEPDAED